MYFSFPFLSVSVRIPSFGCRIVNAGFPVVTVYTPCILPPHQEGALLLSLTLNMETQAKDWMIYMHLEQMIPAATHGIGKHLIKETISKYA